MVNYSRSAGGLDALFGALADPTRRAVLARLRQGDHSIGELAQPFGMSLPGFIKHLDILEDAGLIERHKSGRVVNCRLQAGALKAALEWLEHYEQFWTRRLDRLGAYLERKESDAWKPQSTTRPASRSGATTTSPSRPSTRRGRSRRR
jgi:DNA-binding transcriptional ArsR family regulator